MNGKNLESRVKRLESEVPLDFCTCMDPRPGQTDDEAVEEFYEKYPQLRDRDDLELIFLFP